jgi:hypothetical protein
MEFLLSKKIFNNLQNTSHSKWEVFPLFPTCENTSLHLITTLNCIGLVLFERKNWEELFFTIYVLKSTEQTRRNINRALSKMKNTLIFG